MMFRVKQYEVQGLPILIDIVVRLNSRTEVKTIQDRLKKRLANPKEYTDLSQADIDSIFIPVKEDWADEDDGGAYGAIKPVFALIKKLMFED